MVKKPSKGIMALKIAIMEKSPKDKKADKGKKEMMPEMIEYKKPTKATKKGAITMAKKSTKSTGKGGKKGC